MREIKFRGKSKDTGKWVFGDLQLGDGDHIPMIGEVWCGHDPCYSQVGQSYPLEYIDKEGNIYTCGEADRIWDDSIDWEQRRYEIARDALVGILSNDEERKRHIECLRKQGWSGEELNEQIIRGVSLWAVYYADELIKQLKGE